MNTVNTVNADRAMRSAGSPWTVLASALRWLAERISPAPRVRPSQLLDQRQARWLGIVPMPEAQFVELYGGSFPVDWLMAGGDEIAEDVYRNIAEMLRCCYCGVRLTVNFTNEKLACWMDEQGGIFCRDMKKPHTVDIQVLLMMRQHRMNPPALGCSHQQSLGTHYVGCPACTHTMKVTMEDASRFEENFLVYSSHIRRGEVVLSELHAPSCGWNETGSHGDCGCSPIIEWGTPEELHARQAGADRPGREHGGSPHRVN